MKTAARFETDPPQASPPPGGWVVPPEKPAVNPNDSHMASCPVCRRPYEDRGLISPLCGGVKRLVRSFGMVVAGGLRLARFAVASVLCVVGVIGFCCHALGRRIAHPEDRHLLLLGGRRKAETPPSGCGRQGGAEPR